MSAISWAGVEAFSSPASTSTASSGDDWLRSFMSSVALGLQPSFAWPGSGGGSAASAGESLLGNARCASAGSSAVTGGFGNGFLLFNTARASLHHIGSTATMLLGHASMVDHGGGITAPFTAHWLTQSGTTTMLSSASLFGTLSVVWPTPYSVAPPYVQIAQIVEDGGVQFQNYVVHVSSVTTGGMTSVYSGVWASGPPFTLTIFGWESNGTVAN